MKVNWENAPEDAMYAAQDSDGSIKFYEAKPHPYEHSWSAENGDTWYAFGEVSDWRNSLTARNSCDPSQKNESKQIEEVMALVKAHQDAWIEFLSCEEDEAPFVKLNSDAALTAIESKLRELLPVWLPIESAEKPAIGSNGFGERVLLLVDCGDGTLKSTKIGWWCNKWMMDTGGSVKEHGYRAVGWMPLPKAPG